MFTYFLGYFVPAVIAALVFGVNFDFAQARAGSLRYLRSWLFRALALWPFTLIYFWLFRPAYVGPFWGMLSLVVTLPLIIISFTVIKYYEEKIRLISRMRSPLAIFSEGHTWIYFILLFAAIFPIARILEGFLLSFFMIYTLAWIYLKLVVRFIPIRFSYRKVEQSESEIALGAGNRGPVDETPDHEPKEEREEDAGDVVVSSNDQSSQQPVTSGAESSEPLTPLNAADRLNNAALRGVFNVIKLVWAPIFTFLQWIFTVPIKKYKGPMPTRTPLFPGETANAGLCIILLAIAALIWSLSGGVLFHAEHYASLIGEVKDGGEWSTSFPGEGIERVVLIEEEQAVVLGARALGQSTEKLGARFHPAYYTKQRVQGRTVWVAPLEFNDLRHFWTTRNSPGYVLIEAERLNDPARFVNMRGKKKLEFRYMMSCWSWQYLLRHCYTNGYRGIQLEVVGFELDEKLTPWWVIVMKKPTAAFSAPALTGVLLVSPESGEICPHSFQSLPDWVDTAIPSNLALKYANWWGEYRGGISARYVTSQGIVTSSVKNPALVSRVWDRGGKPYYTIGMSIAGHDGGSLVSYLAVNSRTGAAVEYRSSGADAAGATDVILGVTSNYRSWTVPQIVPRVLAGRECWVGPVISTDGVYQRFAIVDQGESRAVLGVTPPEALKTYFSMMSGLGHNFKGSGVREEVVRITDIVDVSRTDGGYSFLTKEYPKRIFFVSGNVSRWLPFTKQEDVVKIAFVDTGEHESIVLNFKNGRFENQIEASFLMKDFDAK